MKIVNYLRINWVWFLLIIVFGLLIGSCNKDSAPDKFYSCPNCLLEPEAGPCNAYFVRYYYDHEEMRCKEFGWGGCGGVVPFESLDECEACTCTADNPIYDCSSCDLDPDPGPCEALIAKYYFDKNEGKCKSFDWGGCDGLVPFDSKAECEACACYDVLDIPVQACSDCTLEPNPGPCLGFFIRYYFDSSENACREFVWGGCGGVVPFESLDECLDCNCAIE